MATIPMIASIGLCDKEQATLQAVLDVAAGLEIGPWQLATHSQPATAVFVNMDTASAKEWLADIQKRGSSTLLVMCTAQKQLNAPYAYQITLPLNYRSVVLLLKELESRFNSSQDSKNDLYITPDALQAILRTYPYQAPEMLLDEAPAVELSGSIDVEGEGLIADLASLPDADLHDLAEEPRQEEAASHLLPDAELDADSVIESQITEPQQKVDGDEIDLDNESNVIELIPNGIQGSDVELEVDVSLKDLVSEADDGGEGLLSGVLEEEELPHLESQDSASEVENCFDDQGNGTLQGSESLNEQLMDIELEDNVSTSSVPADLETEVESCFEANTGEGGERSPESSNHETVGSKAEEVMDLEQISVIPLLAASDEAVVDNKASLKKSHTYLPQRGLFEPPQSAKSNKSADDLLQMLNRPAMRFYRYTRLLGLVHSIVEQNQAAVVSHPTLPAMVICPASGVFGTVEPLDKEPELFTTAAYKFQVQEISSVDLGEVMVGCIVQPLWALFYSAALFGSEGRLMEAFAPCDVLRLKRLPDFKRVPHSKEHLKMAKYLVSHNVDMMALASITETPLSAVIDFCNACEEAGLIKRLPAIHNRFDDGPSGSGGGGSRKTKVAGFPSTAGGHKKTKFKHRVRSSFCRKKDGASLRAANDSR